MLQHLLHVSWSHSRAAELNWLRRNLLKLTSIWCLLKVPSPPENCSTITRLRYVWLPRCAHLNSVHYLNVSMTAKWDQKKLISLFQVLWDRRQCACGRKLCLTHTTSKPMLWLRQFRSHFGLASPMSQCKSGVSPIRIFEASSTAIFCHNMKKPSIIWQGQESCSWQLRAIGNEDQSKVQHLSDHVYVWATTFHQGFLRVASHFCWWIPLSMVKCTCCWVR